MLSISEVLQRAGVSFVEQDSASVSSKCVGISCPFCEERGKSPDKGFHLGVFRDSGGFYCWRCQAKGTLWQLLKRLAPRSDIKGLVKDFKGITYNVVETSNIFDNKSLVAGALPYKEALESERPECDLFRKFIRELRQIRNIHEEELERRGVLYGCYGRVAYRVLFPVYYQGQIKGWVGRDLTGESRAKYINYGVSREYLYGYDDVEANRSVIVCEGVFDQIRLGSNSVAILGSKMTSDQILKLLELSPIQVFVMLDGDTIKRKMSNKTIATGPSIKLGVELRQYFDRVAVIELPKKEDPASCKDPQDFILGARYLC